MLLDRRTQGGPGDLAVVRKGRGRARVERVLGPASSIEVVLQGLLVEEGELRGFEPYDSPSIDSSGRVDLRVQSLLAVIADRYRIRLSCLRTGHSKFVKGTTRVSNHTVWRAVDIDMVDGRPVSRHSRAARTLALWLDGLQGPLRPSEVGSPFAFGRRPYFSDEGHQEHVHIGYGTLPP